MPPDPAARSDWPATGSSVSMRSNFVAAALASVVYAGTSQTYLGEGESDMEGLEEGEEEGYALAAVAVVDVVALARELLEGAGGHFADVVAVVGLYSRCQLPGPSYSVRGDGVRRSCGCIGIRPCFPAS